MVNGYSIMDMQRPYIPTAALKFLGKTPEHDFTTGLKRYRRAYDMMVNVDAHPQYRIRRALTHLL